MGYQVKLHKSRVTALEGTLGMILFRGEMGDELFEPTTVLLLINFLPSAVKMATLKLKALALQSSLKIINTCY